MGWGRRGEHDNRALRPARLHHLEPPHVVARPAVELESRADRRTVRRGTAMIGVPVSTTHVISTSIMGAGATKRLSAVKRGVVQRILWAWVLTLPVTALLGYWLDRLIQ